MQCLPYDLRKDYITLKFIFITLHYITIHYITLQCMPEVSVLIYANHPSAVCHSRSVWHFFQCVSAVALLLWLTHFSFFVLPTSPSFFLAFPLSLPFSFFLPSFLADLENFKTHRRSSVSVRAGQGVVLLCGPPSHSGGKHNQKWTWFMRPWLTAARALCHISRVFLCFIQKIASQFWKRNFFLFFFSFWSQTHRK